MRSAAAYNRGVSRPTPPDKHFTATGFLVRDGKVLLVNHRKLKKWLPIGGHIEAGEDPAQALRREVREEVGLDIAIVADTLPVDSDDVRGLPRPETILLETIGPGHFHIDLIYFGHAVGGEPRLAPAEHSEQRWFSAQDLGADEISDDVRLLGRRAIETLAARSSR